MRKSLILLVFIGGFSHCTTLSHSFSFITKPYEEGVDKTKLAELLHKAKDSYKKGQMGRTWDYVNESEELSPNDARVLAMKGSLLYKIGDNEKAKEYWERSLESNPNQPNIKDFLKKIGEKEI